MICKKCGSDHTQHLETAYFGGPDETSSAADFMGYDNDSPTLQTNKAAPPTKWPIFGFIIILLLSSIVTASTIMAKSSWSYFLMPLTLLLSYIVIKCITYNLYEHGKEYDRWQDNRYCHKCGHIYQHDVEAARHES